VATLGAAGIQHLPAILCGHASPEAVLVPSFPVMGLKRPFHLLGLLSNYLNKKYRT
jgi:hypothetical protein